MPIYMRITQNGLPVITGDVIAKGHEKWIALDSFQWGPTRAVYTPGGTGGQAEARKPAVREIVVTKMPDSASRLLMMEALTSATSAKGALKIQIDFTKPDKTGEVISLALTLQEVILSGYGLSGTTRGGEPSEQLTLNFTKIAYNSIESPADASPNMGWRHINP